MTVLHQDDLLRCVANAPAEGITAGDIADKLAQNHERVAQRLGKLALWGWIIREYVPRDGGGKRQPRYWPKNTPAPWLPNIAGPPT